MRPPRRHNRSPAALLVRPLAFCSILAQAIAPCVLLADSHEGGRLPVFRIHTQDRTPHEVGAELGRQWKKAFPQLEQQLDSLLEQRLRQRPTAYKVDTRSFSPITAFDFELTQTYRKEFEGLASALDLVSRNRPGDGVLSLHELLLVQRLPDLGVHDSGSAFGVYGTRSATEASLVGRNLDGQPNQQNKERELASITVYQGKENKLVNIGFAGNLGVTTGFNQSGLFLAYIQASDVSNQETDDATGEPIAFTIRRMLETQDHIDSTALALGARIDAGDYNILMADRDRIEVLEHAAGKPGRLRDTSSELQPAMAWAPKQQIAAVGCFALRGMPTACDKVRDRVRWQRFRTLAEQDLKGSRITITDLADIMRDRVGSYHAINSDTTYQVLAFAPDNAELYLGTKSAAATDPAGPVMHRYANLVGAVSHNSSELRIKWLVLWFTIAGIAIATLWIRLRSPKRPAPSVAD